MKSINVTISDEAHKKLKILTEATKKNQHEIVSAVLERVDLSLIKELRIE